ncbi:hypothetical protein [Paraferrimonas haliotis]|uniref:Uncharacterized protein n=1 Tax=Paraferrimonas haliotis TaxID=2013866 RepID=A0AA37TPJ3_9GAMM|nr:hypothetical protein [Paraferrimonas haliotis]GLS83258.1 hypothetical protein GCM10007894_12350 [Paraferrimonas haliotis]
MPTDTFTVTGNNKYDYWLVNGRRDWAVIPSGTITGFDEDLPIRLQVGHAGFGQIHIEKRHRHWLRKINKSLQEVLALKLAQPGTIYSTEEDRKIKIAMRLSPDALLILRLTPHRYGNFLTVVSLYIRNGKLDGDILGRYCSSFKN